MIIRQATVRDLNRILDFMGQQQVRKKDWHISAKKFVKSYIINKHNFFFICCDNNAVVGSIAGELWSDKGFAYVGEITAKGKYAQRIIDIMFKKFVTFCKTKKITIINTYVKQNRYNQIRT